MGALGGIKVIEMGHVVAVPSAGALLADWGAEVIKVEPLSGDMLRGLESFMGVSRRKKFDYGEIHWEVEYLNRGKKSLAVDLRHDSGKEIIYKLVKGSDVFISNYEVNVLKKLKMDYPTLSQINPKLIYGVLTGYGPVGPDKDERGFDYSAAWARSGMQYLIGEPGYPPPTQRPGLMDRVTGGYVVAGILASLLYRERTGKGQELDFSLYHSGVWTIATDIQGVLMGLPAPKNDRLKAPNALWNYYRTKDDKWFMLAMLQSDLYWPAFCYAIERPGLEKQSKFSTRLAREQYCEELVHILDEIFATKSMAEWEKSFKEHNLIYGRIQTAEEVVNDPQALANEFFVEIQHPTCGRFKLVATPVKFHGTPASIKGPAPEVGQHTEEILLELGYTWDDIVMLKEQGVII